ncbi:MAG TPA: glycosyltransferase [Clostridia bacterium]|nr:glycosyltransferase [Clostridia bacterium]
MRITLFAAGSQGDVLFCLRLLPRLSAEGFEVLFAAPENFRALAETHGVPFFPLRGDVQQIMASETGKEFMATGSTNPVKNIALMRKMVSRIAKEMSEDLLLACEQTDALITLAIFASLGATVAELKKIPLLLIEPTPMLPTGDFPAPGWPVQANMGRLCNRLSGYVMLAFIFAWYRPSLNEFRRQNGLNSITSRDFIRTLRLTPLLGAYSSAVIPKPSDWPESAHVTGYWIEQDESMWQPSPELAAFLAQGEPPVYIGFGSMTAKDPEALSRLVLDAVLLTGQRAVIATGWGAITPQINSEQVFVLDQAPHGWLFPRMRAIVHHGGAGTTAEALRAGKPSVIVPFIVDQQFWGKRVEAMGAGTAPIPVRKLTAARLADAIEQACGKELHQNAAEIGRTIRAEQGLDRAVAYIRELWGNRI